MTKTTEERVTDIYHDIGHWGTICQGSESGNEMKLAFYVAT